MSYKKTYLSLWLLLGLALATVIIFSFLFEEGSFGLKRGTFKDMILKQDPMAEGAKDSAAILDSLEQLAAAKKHEPDTTIKSVLIFGDSMTILVANRMAAYGQKNGYEITSVTWDSSSSVGWGNCDTLDNFIRRCHPDFIMVTLGSNELFLRDFTKRAENVKNVVKKMGDIPFVWIGPPNWKKDQGFNEMLEATLPAGTFFRTEGMELPRRNDHIHPTQEGGNIWTDSIMRWIPNSAHPILAEYPDSGVKTLPHNSYYYRAK